MNQKDYMRYLLLGGAAYVAARTASTVLKWGLFAGLAYVVYQDVKANEGKIMGNPGGWGVDIDYLGLVTKLMPNLAPNSSAMMAATMGHMVERMTRS